MKKYEILYQKYKDDILNGYLIKGERLPSIRESCSLFKVSQTTVEHAYNKLCEDGYIVSIPQTGYIVDSTQVQIDLRKQVEEVRNHQKPEEFRYDYRTNAVIKDESELNLIRRYSRYVFDRIDVLSMYGDPQGEIELREALSQYGYRNRGVLSTPERIVVGASFQSLLYLLCGMLDKSNTIGVPADCPKHTLHVFFAYGFRVVYLDPDNLIEDIQNKSCRILYITSSCFGKWKKPISSKDRDAILSYTEKQNILVIEDDYNGELTYVSKKRNAIQSYAHSDHVIYCGSFSRLMVPSMRLSYMVLPVFLSERFLKEKKYISPTASKVEQLTFCSYIVDGYLEKHVRRLKKEYLQRCRSFELILKEYFTGYYLNEAYMSYILPVENCDFMKLNILCKEKSVGISFRNNALELSFAAIEKNRMKEGISVLAKLLKEC